MAESSSDLTFSIGADFSGFTKAADSAGAKLDQLGQAAGRWAVGTSAAVSKTLGAPPGPLQLSRSLGLAGQALQSPATVADDDQGAKVLARLGDQLALLKTTGAAHEAIAERMKIETEQAKLGTDATLQQKQAVASLVTQIDAAKAARTALTARQDSVDEAVGYGASVAQSSLEQLVLGRARLQDVARSALAGFARQGLDAALSGTGSLAGLFGTQASGGGTGGLFGALASLFSGGLTTTGSSATSSAGFAGLYADGGSIGAGQWGIAGEKGAEIVAGPATVMPWAKIPAAAAASAPHQTINFNVTTPDAPSFARSESQMTALLSRAVGRGQRNA